MSAVNLDTLGFLVGVLGKGEGVASALGVWSLVFIWSLDLGAWCFLQVHSPMRDLQIVEATHGTCALCWARRFSRHSQYVRMWASRKNWFPLVVTEVTAVAIPFVLLTTSPS